MIRAVIFDCFGVLLTDALSIICDELAQRDPEAVENVRAMIHAANRGILSPEDSTEQVAGILGITVSEYREKIKASEVRDNRLFEYIKRLHDPYKTALLSNITQQGLDRRFPDNELHEYFDAIIASSTVGFAKPDPEIYELAAERLGVQASECVFLDDREDYCEAARGVGMQAIWYQSFQQARADLEKILA